MAGSEKYDALTISLILSSRIEDMLKFVKNIDVSWPDETPIGYWTTIVGKLTDVRGKLDGGEVEVSILVPDTALNIPAVVSVKWAKDKLPFWWTWDISISNVFDNPKKVSLSAVGDVLRDIKLTMENRIKVKYLNRRYTVVKGRKGAKIKFGSET